MDNTVKTRGFTLIELVVSITILSVILVSVFMIYSHLIAINKRLQIMRIVQENTRSITEEMANAIREKGINIAYYDGSADRGGLDYTGSGTRVLAINWGIQYYTMKDVPGSTPVKCSDEEMRTPNIHCFMGKEEWWTRVPLSDERVRINNARFFISGDTVPADPLMGRSPKATIVLSLGIENNNGLSSELVKGSQMHIETTISEKIYKK